jgi:HTH-type transcriptional regulator, glycine betaine synthesis regulator
LAGKPVDDQGRQHRLFAGANVHLFLKFQINVKTVRLFSGLGPNGQCEDLEEALVALLTHFAQCLGASKSVGAIYGCLFVSSEPITSEDIVKRLCLSAGSVSQGLRILKSAGAVHDAFVRGDRRNYFVAERGLTQLITGILRETIQGHLIYSEDQLDKIARLLEDETPKNRHDIPPQFSERLQTVRQWHSEARGILRLVFDSLIERDPRRGAENGSIRP